MRLALGFGLLTAAWLAPVNRWARIGAVAAAAEMIFAGAMRFCPVSELLGHRNCDAPLLDETLAGRLEREELLGSAQPIELPTQA